MSRRLGSIISAGALALGLAAPSLLAQPAQAKKAGEQLAEAAKAAGITKVVFDRGGNTYTGRIAAFADAAREAGLEF